MHLNKSLKAPLPHLHNVYRTVDTGHPTLPHLDPRKVSYSPQKRDFFWGLPKDEEEEGEFGAVRYLMF